MNSGLKNIVLCTLLLTAALLTGCATSQPDSRSGATFVLVRHAEKATDDPKDPTLTPAGIERAQRLSTMFAGKTIAAVYSTTYRRTQLTAAPTASSHLLNVRTYDGTTPAEAFSTQLRREHVTGTVLVVGHSNTVPALAAALCTCTVAPILDDEYDRMIKIRIGGDGVVSIEQTRF